MRQIKRKASFKVLSIIFLEFFLLSQIGWASVSQEMLSSYDPGFTASCPINTNSSFSINIPLEYEDSTFFASSESTLEEINGFTIIQSDSSNNIQLINQYFYVEIVIADSVPPLQGVEDIRNYLENPVGVQEILLERINVDEEKDVFCYSFKDVINSENLAIERIELDESSGQVSVEGGIVIDYLEVSCELDNGELNYPDTVNSISSVENFIQIVGTTYMEENYPELASQLNFFMHFVLNSYFNNATGSWPKSISSLEVSFPGNDYIISYDNQHMSINSLEEDSTDMDVTINSVVEISRGLNLPAEYTLSFSKDSEALQSLSHKITYFPESALENPWESIEIRDCQTQKLLYKAERELSEDGLQILSFSETQYDSNEEIVSQRKTERLDDGSSRYVLADKWNKIIIYYDVTEKIRREEHYVMNPAEGEYQLDYMKNVSDVNSWQNASDEVFQHYFYIVGNVWSFSDQNLGLGDITLSQRIDQVLISAVASSETGEGIYYNMLDIGGYHGEYSSSIYQRLYEYRACLTSDGSDLKALFGQELQRYLPLRQIETADGLVDVWGIVAFESDKIDLDKANIRDAILNTSLESKVMDLYDMIMEENGSWFTQLTSEQKRDVFRKFLEPLKIDEEGLISAVFESVDTEYETFVEIFDRYFMKEVDIPKYDESDFADKFLYILGGAKSSDSLNSFVDTICSYQSNIQAFPGDIRIEEFYMGKDNFYNDRELAFVDVYQETAGEERRLLQRWAGANIYKFTEWDQEGSPIACELDGEFISFPHEDILKAGSPGDWEEMNQAPNSLFPMIPKVPEWMCHGKVGLTLIKKRYATDGLNVAATPDFESFRPVEFGDTFNESYFTQDEFLSRDPEILKTFLNLNTVTRGLIEKFNISISELEGKPLSVVFYEINQTIADRLGFSNEMREEQLEHLSVVRREYYLREVLGITEESKIAACLYESNEVIAEVFRMESIGYSEEQIQGFLAIDESLDGIASELVYMSRAEIEVNLAEFGYSSEQVDEFFAIEDACRLESESVLQLLKEVYGDDIEQIMITAFEDSIKGTPMQALIDSEEYREFKEEVGLMGVITSDPEIAKIVLNRLLLYYDDYEDIDLDELITDFNSIASRNSDVIKDYLDVVLIGTEDFNDWTDKEIRSALSCAYLKTRRGEESADDAYERRADLFSAWMEANRDVGYPAFGVAPTQDIMIAPYSDRMNWAQFAGWSLTGLSAAFLVASGIGAISAVTLPVWLTPIVANAGLAKVAAFTVAGTLLTGVMTGSWAQAPYGGIQGFLLGITYQILPSVISGTLRLGRPLLAKILGSTVRASNFLLESASQRALLIPLIKTATGTAFKGHKVLTLAERFGWFIGSYKFISQPIAEGVANIAMRRKGLDPQDSQNLWIHELANIGALLIMPLFIPGSWAMNTSVIYSGGEYQAIRPFTTANNVSHYIGNWTTRGSFRSYGSSQLSGAIAMPLGVQRLLEELDQDVTGIELGVALDSYGVENEEWRATLNTDFDSWKMVYEILSELGVLEDGE
ncbi:MAG: hypothetical protein P9L98_05135 [Candidatus Kaelpia imicola]|nr:hypothetical protein [Candidatus Kaelpia imicola]